LCIVDGTKRKEVCSNWINSLGLGDDLGDEINCVIRIWVLLYIVEFPLYSMVWYGMAWHGMAWHTVQYTFIYHSVYVSFFWSWCYLFIFYLWIIITSLVSPNFSYIWIRYYWFQIDVTIFQQIFIDFKFNVGFYDILFLLICYSALHTVLNLKVYIIVNLCKSNMKRIMT